VEIQIGSPALYAAFAAAVVVFLVIDFVLLRAKGSHKVPVAEAAAWSVVWFALAMAFAGWLWWHVRGLHGEELANTKALEYVTGYLPAMLAVILSVIALSIAASIALRKAESPPNA